MKQVVSRDDENDPAALAQRDASAYPADRFGITVKELEAIVQRASRANEIAGEERRE